MFGTLHCKYIENTPKILRAKNAIKEAEYIEKFLEQLKVAVTSPDSDYPQFTGLWDYLPDNLKAVIPNTSPMKFEHVLVDDCPKEIESILKNICDKLNVPFRYADVTLVSWFQKAIDSYAQGQELDFIRHLGRCCHLIQDVCVPMHCKVMGNLKDIFDVLQHKDANHEKFEAYCLSSYTIEGIDVDLSLPYFVPGTLQKTAIQSRSYMQMCDGIRFSGFWFKVLKFLGIVKFNEDYKSAADYSNRTAQALTVNFLYNAMKVIVKL